MFEIKHKRSHIVHFHLCNMSRLGKSHRDRKMSVGRGLGEGEEMAADGYEICFGGGDENF